VIVAPGLMVSRHGLAPLHRHHRQVFRFAGARQSEDLKRFRQQ
jgi:hypothetical protein